MLLWRRRRARTGVRPHGWFVSPWPGSWFVVLVTASLVAFAIEAWDYGQRRRVAGLADRAILGMERTWGGELARAAWLGDETRADLHGLIRSLTVDERRSAATAALEGFAEGRAGPAIGLYRTALEDAVASRRSTDRLDVLPLSLRPGLLLSLERPDESMAVYRRATELEPDAPEVWLALLRAARDRGDLETAEHAAAAIRRLSGGERARFINDMENLAEATGDLALANLAAGRADVAMEGLVAAAAMNRQLGRSHEAAAQHAFLAALLYERGRIRQVGSQLDAALQLFDAGGCAAVEAAVDALAKMARRTLADGLACR